MTVYNVPFSLNGSWDTQKLCDVPAGFHIRDQIRQKAVIANYDNDYSCGLWLNKDNCLYVANFGGTGLRGSFTVSCTASWVTQDTFPA